MDDERIQNFSDLVAASEQITRPWRKLALWLIFLLFASNLIWGFVHWYHIRVAYMEPTQIVQEQDFDEHKQNQSYASGSTNGG